MNNPKITLKYQRAIYIALAFILFAFFQYGKNQWLVSGHGLIDAWKGATETDWLLTITFFDGGIFTLICLTWMVYDLKKQRLNKILKILFFLLTLAFGAAGFFLYLGIRHPVTHPPVENL